LSVPYAPCYAEHLLLQGRNILADQAAVHSSTGQEKAVSPRVYQRYWYLGKYHIF
jgi:hypothetical protein